MVNLLFLGTGGGRFTTLYQTRATGGLYIFDDKRIHIDPGPGALIQMHNHNLNPKKTDAILISHSHTDHYSDGEVLIECMTNGGTEKRGMLFASESVINGYENLGPAVSKYHKSLLEKVQNLNPGEEFQIGNMDITATKSFHSDPTTIGFKLSTQDGIISYVVDTAYNDQLIEEHKNARLMVISVTRPLNARIPFHLSTEDAVKLVSQVNPEIVIITHFGYKMLRENTVEKQADWIWKETSIKTIAAKDSMRISMEKEIEIKE